MQVKIRRGESYIRDAWYPFSVLRGPKTYSTFMKLFNVMIKCDTWNLKRYKLTILGGKIIMIMVIFGKGHTITILTPVSKKISKARHNLKLRTCPPAY